MFRETRNNIIKDYTDDIIINYYDNEYIDKNKIDYLTICVDKIRKSDQYIHFTANMDIILTSHEILCSSGGLGGVMYVTPLNNLKLHNLGSYILNDELPMFMKINNDSNSISSLVVKIYNPKIGCIDYLEFGIWYYQIYNKHFKNKIDKQLLNETYDVLLNNIKEIIKLSEDKNNIEKIFDIMCSFNVFKIYLFEAILDYLYLFQNDYSDELNGAVVKKIIYLTCPELKKKFSLSKLNIKFNKLYENILQSGTYETKNIKEYIIARINHFIKKYLLCDKENLLGQIIFRNFNLRKRLEKKFADILWKEAKTNGYNILTYYSPKGELGILPYGNDKIFKCEIIEDKCFIKDSIEVKIKDRIIDSGIMRNPYKEEKKMELPIKVQGVMYSKENDKIEYLIIKRCKADGGFWQGVTGTLEEGEKLKDCLVREIKEELGITEIKNISELKQTIQWAKKSGFMITEYVFSVELDRNSKVTLSCEHDDYKWCDFEKAYDMLGKDNNKNTLKIMNEELENGNE